MMIIMTPLQFLSRHSGERPEAMQTGSSNLANKTNRLFVILVISYIFEYFIPVFNLYSNICYEGRR